jgi:transcriptional regulator with XRE-family HTH domain
MPPDSPTLDSLIQTRQRLRLSEHSMAQLLGVTTRMVLRWERGETQMPRITRRALMMLEFMERELPGKFASYLAANRRIKKRGRPVGSLNVPEWMRPPPKPRELSYRFPGRPRKLGSERPVRRKCRKCDCNMTLPPDVRYYNGARLCETCRSNIIAEQKVARELAQSMPAPVAAAPAPVVVASLKTCHVCKSKPVIGPGLICAECRIATGVPLRRELYEGL